MSMNINNSLINPRTFLTESNLGEAKEVKNGDQTSIVTAMSGQLAEGIAKNIEAKIKELSQTFLKTAPELRAPEKTDGNDLKSLGIQALAGVLEHVITSFITGDSSAKAAEKAGKTSNASNDESYTKINENAFAALYSQLLALFGMLNESSGKMTGMHATLAEKLTISSGKKMIDAAIAQKNQTIASAATSMGMGGAGLYMSTKGITQQQSALKQKSVSSELNGVNSSITNTATNGSNLQKAEVSAEKVGNNILNEKGTTKMANTTEADLMTLAGNKKTNTGQTVGNMGHGAGNMVGSGYGVESATENAGAQLDNVAKDSMLETEVKNRESQNAARNSLKQILDLIYQTLEKNNEAVSHTAQMIKA